jgi:hypothetical protein
MVVTFAAVGLATAGLVVLAVLSVRVWAAARGLGREVERTRGLLAQQRARASRPAPRGSAPAGGRAAGGPANGRSTGQQG